MSSSAVDYDKRSKSVAKSSNRFEIIGLKLQNTEGYHIHKIFKIL